MDFPPLVFFLYLPLLGGDSERLTLSLTVSLTGDLTEGKDTGGDTVMGDLTDGNGGGEERRSAYCQRKTERF